MKIRYSVIVCAYNARERLPATLTHLSVIDYPDDEWEVVFVDNRSTDGTVQRAHEVWASKGSSVPFRMVHESQQGLSFARRTGSRHARGQIFVFCDDDNWLSPDFFRVADQMYEKLGPRCLLGAAATPAFAVAHNDVPAFFYTSASALAIGAVTLETEDVTASRGWLMGAGLVVPRSAFDELEARGFEQGLPCRVANSLSTGGDVELCYVLTLMGWRTISAPELKLTHFIPASRLTVDYIKRLQEGNNDAEAILLPYRILREIRFSNQPYLKRLLRHFLYLVRQPSALRAEAVWFVISGGRGVYRRLPVRWSHR
jgi:glycosyltransferase involved in cell wall biosynthesis